MDEVWLACGSMTLNGGRLSMVGLGRRVEFVGYIFLEAAHTYAGVDLPKRSLGATPAADVSCRLCGLCMSIRWLDAAEMLRYE